MILVKVVYIYIHIYIYGPGPRSGTPPDGMVPQAGYPPATPQMVVRMREL